MKEKEFEKAILVGSIVPEQKAALVESSLKELSLLAETAQVQTLFTLTQKRIRLDPSYYLGKGKVAEIQLLAEELEADVVIFNDELSPTQARNLERMLNLKVIDRTQLILDIFALRAKSKEGQLQVELAQLKYLLPRIVGQGTSLSRLGGGIGTRGPGETKLETDRRHIRKRIKDIEEALEKIVAHRERYRERRRRNHVFQVALVGYTNAGKSTLLNQLTAANTYVEDQLFATLDPTTKQLKLPSGLQVLVSDTVGFIQDLPTTLIAAFRSTLEELKEADLIIHVIDSQNEQYREQMKVVENLIDELGAAHLPILNLFNKKDLPPSSGLIINQEDLYVSAYNKIDLDRFKARIEAELLKTMHCYELFIPAQDSELLAKFREQGLIQEIKYTEDKEAYFIKVFLPYFHTLREYIE